MISQVFLKLSLVNNNNIPLNPLLIYDYLNKFEQTLDNEETKSEDKENLHFDKKWLESEKLSNYLI